MNTIKKISQSAFIIALSSMMLVSCSDDDEEEVTPPNGGGGDGVVTLTTNITENTTWTSDNIYVLDGRITVESGAVLTIEPGTIIKGQAGTGANATALLIARGGKLMAEGTADAPIIFTAFADQITQADLEDGNFESPNLDADINGLWGGVIVLGYAPISASNAGADADEVQIEGIPTSDANGLYGGNEPLDDSGILKYISIRHGGTNIGAGNEINGLTLGGVGSTTVIDNIEIVSNQDDGIEWFGGTVNASNLVVWNCGDDGLDTDQSWAGTADNFVVIGTTGHVFELDGPEGSMQASHTIKNGSVKGSYDGRVSEDIINTDDNSRVTLENIYFTDLVEGQMINRVSWTEGAVEYTNILLNVPAEEVPSYVNGDVPSGISAGTSPQANISGFDWTWTKQSGAMSGL